MINNEQQLQQAIETYYTDYYRDLLGLPDWRRRVEDRLDEENAQAKQNLDLIETWLDYSFADKRVLIVGGGTGAETFALQALGAEVTAIEPDSRAVRILGAKACLRFELANLPVQAVGETLPYPDNHFDFVYCYTVLEHTQHPIRCIDEMIRVVRSKGWIYIVTPDYRQPYEPHYKLVMPTIAPEWVLHIWLRILGRPVEFLDTLQFVNAHRLRNVFQYRPVTAFRVLHSWPRLWLSQPTIRTRLHMWVTQTFGIQRDQHWLLQKLEKPR